MHIIKVGVNYKATPVYIREKLTISENEIEEAMHYLSDQTGILENVIFSTCNRTEIYAVVEELAQGYATIYEFIAHIFHIEKDTFVPYLELLENDEVVNHLFRVTTGINSMVIGETQILGQVRDAFLTAQKLNVTGTIFNELFKRAVTFAKRAHKNTSISGQTVSISYASVQLAKNLLGPLNNKKVVIIGAGEMGELAIRHLLSSGVTNITVVNRTIGNANKLAEQFQIKAAEISSLLTVIQDADIVISSTSSSHPILSKEQVTPIQMGRKETPLFFVDIAVPRDLEPSISELDNIRLYNIDDLHAVIDQGLAARKEAAKEIERLLDSEIEDFKVWVKTLRAVPVIAALKEKAESIQVEVLASIIRKIPQLTKREKKVLHEHTGSIVNQLLKEPINQAKELSVMEQPLESLCLLNDIFGIDEQVKDQVAKQVIHYKGITSS